MSDFDERMAALGERFRARCRADLEPLRDALAMDERAKVASLAHSLAGNAGLFGFAELGERAVALETAARAEGATTGEVRACGEALLRCMEQAAGAAG